MNKVSPVPTISAAERERRAKAVSKANWSAEMEGLGKQTPEYNALSDLWIKGKISRAELEKRQIKMTRDRIKSRV